MRIAFATTLGMQGSTIIGRVFPLAQELAKRHAVHVLLLENAQKLPRTSPIDLRVVGAEPFERTSDGKKRKQGLRLALSLFGIALRTAVTLQRIKPDRVIIVKTLPHNVLGVWLWHLFNRNVKIITDVDDFELTANAITSFFQRFSIQWAERAAVRISSGISVATPFLEDRFKALAPDTMPKKLIITGISSSLRNILPDPEDVAHPDTLLYIGSLSRSSGHRIDLLPLILKQCLAATKLIIAGSGDDEAWLKEEFKTHGVDSRVEWRGRFSETDIPDLLKKIHILLDPVDSSVTERAKSTFRVVLALCAGWPVVTSDVGVRGSLVPAAARSRFFAKPGDAADYAQKIQELCITYPARTERMGWRNSSSELVWKNVAVEFEKLL